MTRKDRKHYNREFKLEAVRMANESGKPVAEVARECKILSSSSVLSDSIRQPVPIQIVNAIRFNSSTDSGSIRQLLDDSEPVLTVCAG